MPDGSGALAQQAPGHPAIVRIIAPNPGPMTLGGTNSYVVGANPAWVVDPGPAIPVHIAEIRAVCESRGGIGGVVLTHSHHDHCEGVEMLGIEPALGMVGADGEFEAFAAAAADARGPLPVNGSIVRSGSAPAKAPAEVGPFQVVPTPGHAVDHVAFVVNRVCLCGDLILGEGSSIVPPAAGGGSLLDYMASLRRLGALPLDLLSPGHGGWIGDPSAKIRDYIAHRHAREEKLLAALAGGIVDREELLDRAWGDVAAPLRPAAALAMQAHLEKLAAESRIPELPAA